MREYRFVIHTHIPRSFIPFHTSLLICTMSSAGSGTKDQLKHMSARWSASCRKARHSIQSLRHIGPSCLEESDALCDCGRVESKQSLGHDFEQKTPPSDAALDLMEKGQTRVRFNTLTVTREALLTLSVLLQSFDKELRIVNGVYEWVLAYAEELIYPPDDQ